MYLEASLGLSFQRAAELVRVPPPTAMGHVLHWLTLGHASDPWEREVFEPVATIRSLAGALHDAGVRDLVSAAADEEIVFLDERGRDDDLVPALLSIADRAGREGEGPAHLELVAMLRDDVGTYLVQLTAERLHPVDRLPVRVRVFGLLRAFDVDGLETAGYRGGSGTIEDAIERRIVEVLRSPDGVDAMVAQLRTRVAEVCSRIEASVRERLGTYPTEAVLLCCAVRPRERVAFKGFRPSPEPSVIPVLRDIPGLRHAAFYLQSWLGAVTQLRARVRKTLIVDRRGNPIVHIADEAADLGSTQAYVPGASIAEPPGALDVLYFGGHEFEDELRNGGRLPPHDGLVGEPAWKRIRERELGVKPKFSGRDMFGELTGALGTSSIIVDTGPGYTGAGDIGS